VGKVPGGGEGAAVADRQEQGDAGARADAGHRHQHLGQGVVGQQLLEVSSDLSALAQRCHQLLGHT